MAAEQQIPTEQDWGNYSDDLDQTYAHRIFSGKSRDEARNIFRNAVLERIDELRYMPPLPFRYYTLALRDYVTSKDAMESDMASDAASAFLDLILEKVLNSWNVIGPIMFELLPAADYIARHQPLYNASEKVYGRFADRYAEIQMRLQGQSTDD